MRKCTPAWGRSEIAGPQGQFPGCAAGQRDPPVAGYKGQNQYSFHPRTGAKRKVTEAQPPRFVLLSEPLWIEASRILPETRVAMGHHLRRQQYSSFGDRDPAISVFFCRSARRHPHWGVDANCLRNYLSGITQLPV